MGIDAIRATGATTGASAASDVQAQRTPVTPADLRGALSRAYTRMTGRAPTAGLLDTLTAQASLETGRGASMFNYNFGGIKGASPRGLSASYGTRECTADGDVHIRAKFRAYTSLDEGAEDYIRVMQGRFGGAMPYAAAGDLDGFAHALKQQGYYTAPEAEYATALHNASGIPAGTPHGSASAYGLDGHGALRPAPTEAQMAANVPMLPPSSGELARVFDALSLSVARIAAPGDDADS